MTFSAKCLVGPCGVLYDNALPIATNKSHTRRTVLTAHVYVNVDTA